MAIATNKCEQKAVQSHCGSTTPFWKPENEMLYLSLWDSGEFLCEDRLIIRLSAVNEGSFSHPVLLHAFPNNRLISSQIVRGNEQSNTKKRIKHFGSFGGKH